MLVTEPNLAEHNMKGYNISFMLRKVIQEMTKPSTRHLPVHPSRFAVGRHSPCERVAHAV